MRLRLTCVVLGAAFVASGIGSPASADTVCVYPSTYPGDNAAKNAIAAWMAGGAQAAGIPVELPVMASLGETGLANLNYGDADAVGYFQMRKSIWEGLYPNFENDPTQQLKWFTDQAVAVRQAKINGGDPAYGGDPLRYGDWIAEVERPPEQQRGKYQPYLEQARSLIASGCATEAPSTTPPGTQPPAGSGPSGGSGPVNDTAPPGLKLGNPGTQDVSRTGLVTVVVTTTEDSMATLSVAITVGNATRVYRVSAAPRRVTPGRPVKLRLRLSRKLRGVVRAAVQRGRPPKIKATVVLVDAAGNRSSATRAIRLPRR